MCLFLPILLVGLAQPADQPPAPAASSPQAQRAEPEQLRKFTLTPDTEPRKFSPATDSKQAAPGQVEPFDRIAPDVVTGIGPPLCLTLRSYYFERHDDLAPEYRGMTTCESSRSIAEKRVNRRRARLLPAR